MAQEFDIPSRVVPLAYRIIPHYNIKEEPADKPLDKGSDLGTPVYSNLEFIDSNEKVLLRIDTVLFVVTGTKNIIKTAIQGKIGTIKEYISQGDYSIKVSGSIVSLYPNYYPEEEVKILVGLLEQPNAIPIASNFLLLFGIKNIVIDPEFTISEKLGSRNDVPFEFSAVSDNPEEFELSIT